MKKFLIIFLMILPLVLSGCSVFGETEKTIKIAVIDTGFSSAAIPAENIVTGKNYLDENLSTEDTYGHGTAVASVILELCPDTILVPLVSNAFDGKRIVQVENDVFAKMITDAVDVFDCGIINISAGLVLDKPEVREAILYAEEKGVLVVASVGNDYESGGPFKYYPAGYETVFAVGSLNTEKTEISAFSQRGEWVDVFAVGENVTIKTLSGNTRQSEGTSYSAAKVTAFAASILKKTNRKLSAEELRNAVMEKCEILPDGTKYIP